MQKTTLYDYEPTALYQDAVEKTQLYDKVHTQEYVQEHGLKVDDEITLNFKKYWILDVLSSNSGEAIIYKVKDVNKAIFALKMYFELRNIQDEPNPEALHRIQQITNSDLLKLHDFGLRKDKFQGKFCFEISEFAEGGDLVSISDFTEKYTPELLERYVIPQIFKGIQILHQHKIFHCDLKPQNVFFQNAEQTNLVIGDYGSAKTLDLEDDKDARKTSIVKGTDFYLPPEQARGFISEKNDYYSFGMILLHLTYPEKVCQIGDYSRLNRKKLKEIIVKQFENKPIIRYDPTKGRINDLIAGLTLNNILDRWGKEEVRSWLNGEKITIEKATENKIKQISPIDLGDRVIRTEKEFVRFLEEDEEWYELLFEDRTGHQLYDRWLLSLRGEKERQEVSELVKKYQQNGVEFIKEALVRFFEPMRSLVVENKFFDLATAEDLRFEIAYFCACLFHVEMSENARQVEGFKLLQYAKNQKNRPDFVRLLKIIESTRYIVEPSLPRTHEVPKPKYIKDWLLEIIWGLTLPLGTDDTFFKVIYKGFRDGKIQCERREVLGNYFQEQGKDIFVERVRGERKFILPDFGIQMSEESTEKIFDTNEILEEIKSNILKLENSTKKVYLINFEQFENLILQPDSKFWKYYWHGEFYRLGLNEIQTIIDSSSAQNNDSKYRISYNLHVIKRKVISDNNQLKILHQSEKEEFTLDMNDRSFYSLKHNIPHYVYEAFENKNIDLGFLPQFHKRYQEIENRQKEAANRRKNMLTIAFPFLGLFHLKTILRLDYQQLDMALLLMGIIAFLFVSTAILKPMDTHWFVQQLRLLAFLLGFTYVLFLGSPVLSLVTFIIVGFALFMSTVTSEAIRE